MPQLFQTPAYQTPANMSPRTPVATMTRQQQEEERRKKDREEAERKARQSSTSKGLGSSVKKSVASAVNLNPTRLDDTARANLERSKIDLYGGKEVSEPTPNAMKLLQLNTKYGETQAQIRKIEEDAKKPAPAKTGQGTSVMGGVMPQQDPMYLQKKRDALISQMYGIEKEYHATEGSMTAEDIDSIEREQKFVEAAKKEYERLYGKDTKAGLNDFMLQLNKQLYEFGGLLPAVGNWKDRLIGGASKREVQLKKQAMQEATAPQTLAGKTSEVAGGLAKFGLEVYATAGLLQGVPYASTLINSTKAARIAGGTVKLTPTLTQAAARGGAIFGGREAIVQTTQGLSEGRGYEPIQIATAAAEGALFEGLVAPMLGKVWRRATTNRAGEVTFFFRPGQGGLPTGNMLPGGKPSASWIPKQVQEIAMKTKLDVKGIQRRMIFSMDDGNIYEMRWMPQGNGQVAMQITKDAPNWLKGGARNLVKTFNGEGVKPKKVVDAKVVHDTNEKTIMDIAKQYKNADDFVKAAKTGGVEVPLKNIEIPKAAQEAMKLNPKSYAAAYPEPQGFVDKPIEVFKSGNKFRIEDGIHRFFKAVREGKKSMKVVLYDVDDEALRSLYQQSVGGVDMPVSSISPMIVDIPDRPIAETTKDFLTVGMMNVRRFLGGEFFQRMSQLPADQKFIPASEAAQITRQYFSDAEVPVEVVERLITPEGDRALGRYREGMISFVQNPHESTPDHEAVHAYLDLFAGKQVKDSILEEVISSGRAGNRVDAEEAIADGFVEYVKSGQARGFSRRVIEYFRDMWAKMRGFFKKPDQVRQLYRDIILKRRAGSIELGTTVSKDVWALQQQMYQTPNNLTLKFLKGITKPEVGQQEIRDLLRRPEVKQAEREVMERVLENFKGDQKISVDAIREAVTSELLPLKIVEAGSTGQDFESPLYEGTTLVPEMRGMIDKYTEHIYESPIKTSAGGVHFSTVDHPNYFAHTRVEDMARGAYESADSAGGVGKTRRIIEIQSDLFQKGRLEQESPKPRDLRGMSDEQFDRLVTAEEARSTEISNLEKYRQTWWNRIIKEEIRRAALDGKEILQFPTGETAMKVEGLGQGGDRWIIPENMTDELGIGEPLREDMLKVGEGISDGETGWIITDVLGDGRFQAVPRSKYLDSDTIVLEEGGKKFTELSSELQEKLQKKNSDLYAETFDISGSIDTENPIYKFYESDVTSFLNKYRKGNIETVVDDQGVTWIQTRITPEDQGAVEAFQRDVFSNPNQPTPQEEGRQVVRTKEEQPRFQALSRLPDDPELTPIRQEIQQRTQSLQEAVEYAEGQITEATPVNEDAESLIGLAEEIRTALRQSPSLPGGVRREAFYRELASGGDSVPAISGRLRKLAEGTRSATVSRQLLDIAERMRATGVYDDIADFEPFQTAIVEGRPKTEDVSKMDLIERADRVVREIGDFEVEEGVTMSDLLDEIDMLEFQLNDAIAARTGTQKQPQRKTAKQTAFDVGEGTRGVQRQPKAVGRETRVSGRDLIKAISSVSKSKEQEFRGRLREAVSASKQAAKEKNREKLEIAKEQREGIKRELIDEIRRRVPPARRGKFLSAVKNTNTRNQLKKSLERADKEAEAAEKQEIIGQLKRIADSPLSTVDVGYRQEVDKMLAGIDFSKPTKDTIKKLKSRLEFIERDGGFSIPDKLREEVSRLAKEPVADLSLQSLKNIRDGLATIIQMGKVSRSMKIARMRSERERRLAQLLQTTVNMDKAMKDTGKFTPTQLSSEEVKKNIRRSNGTGVKFTTKPRIFDRADGDMNGKGENVRLWKENTHTPLNKAIRQTYDDTANWMQRIISEVGNDPKMLSPRQQEKYARALYFDQGLEDQMLASGWTYERPQLTEMEEKIVTVLQQEADKYHAELSALHALENNEYLPKVENYFPIKYDREVLRDEEKFGDPRKILYAETKANAAAALRSVEGMLQLRSPGVQKRLRTDVFNILNEQIAARSWLMNVEPELRNVHAIVNSPEYREKAGTMMVEYWNRYIDRVMGENRAFARRYLPEDLLSFNNVSNNLGIAYLTFRLSTTVVQLDQIVSGTSYVLAKYGHLAAGKFFMHTVSNFIKPDLIKNAAEESPVIEFRESGDPITAQIMRRVGVHDASNMMKEMEAFEDALKEAYDERNTIITTMLKWKRKAAKFGFDKFIRVTDVRSTASQFEAFKDLFKSLGATPDEALSDAELATMMTNSDASVAFRPEIFDQIKEMEPGLAKETSRSLLLFQSFNMNKLMEVWHDIIRQKMILRKGTSLPRGGTPPPVRPKSKLPGASGDDGENFMPPQGKGGLVTMYYGAAAVALMVAGGYAFDEIRRSIQNFERSTLPKLFGGKGKAPIESDGALMYAIMFFPRMLPVINGLFEIAKNSATGRDYLDTQVAGATIGRLAQDAKALGNMVSDPSVKNALDILQGAMSLYGVPGTSALFNIVEPIVAPTKQSSGSSRSRGVDRAGSMRRGSTDRSAITR